MLLCILAVNWGSLYLLICCSSSQKPRKHFSHHYWLVVKSIRGAGALAQSAKCLAVKHEALSPDSQGPHESQVWGHTCNPKSGEAEIGGSLGLAVQ